MERCGDMCDYCVDPAATTNKASQAKAQASGSTQFVILELTIVRLECIENILQISKNTLI